MVRQRTDRTMTASGGWSGGGRCALQRVERLLEPAGVRLLGARQRGEPVRDLVEALLAGGLREARVHGGELVGLARNGGREVLLGAADGLARRGVAGGALDELVHVTEGVAGLAGRGVL